MNQRYFSNIYWHFTGSPKNVDWSRCKCPKDILSQGKPQSPDAALKTLFQILKTKKLLAICSERITEKIRTQKFCCVTDIPLKDLELHSKYYGKVAVGFSSNLIHHRFNPVLYFPSIKFPRKTQVPNGGKELIVDDYDDIDVQQFNVDKLPDGRYKLTLNGYQLLLFSTEIDSGKIDRFFADHLKITEFSSRIGQSFYQEREWRHVGDFCFKEDDIEAVIVPKMFKKNVQEFVLRYEDYKHVSILTWELIRMA